MTWDLQHPPSNDLRDFVLGRLGDVESLAIETHLHTCVTCREALIETASTDEFVDRLRRLRKPEAELQADD